MNPANRAGLIDQHQGRRIDANALAVWTSKPAPLLRSQDLERCSNLDGSSKRASNGAAIRMDGMNALDGFLHLPRSAKLIMHRDPADDEDVSVQFYFAHRFRGQFAIRGINLTRFQRAPEGSSQSACSSGDYVIERRGVWRVGVRRDLVMFSNLGVHPEGNRDLFNRKVSQPHGTALTLDANVRRVDDLLRRGHACSPPNLPGKMVGRRV